MFSIDSLNELQRKIALDTEGAILVSAGAGSGKTRLLTHRIVYLIEEKDVNPSNILAITFTNKATNEMKERISQMTSKSNVWISTFHAMCAKILRDNIYRLEGYNRYFTIYDTSDRDKVLKRVAKGLNKQEDFYKTLDYNISTAKNEGLRPYEYGQKFSYVKDIQDIVKGYQEYEEELKRNNSLDFDDLLMKTLILLESSEIPENWTWCRLGMISSYAQSKVKINAQNAALLEGAVLLAEAKAEAYAQLAALCQHGEDIR